MQKKISRETFLNLAREYLPEGADTITRPEVLDICEKYGLDRPNWLFNDVSLRVGRGVYSLGSPVTQKLPMQPPAMIDNEEYVVDMATPVTLVVDHDSFVPDRAQGYVPFGHFNDLRSIIKSKRFYPVYITGLSGNGKTFMVEQVAAAEKREMVRANITCETDEDDLIGGFRLIKGETVWQDGPVIVAMKRGAVLLLDEIDLGSNRLMCLQPVLEGKSIYLKKVNKVVRPEPGFTVVATANTKGKGSDDGRFIGTNIMNEAFLERFSITMEQEYPPIKTELKILSNIMSQAGVDAKDYVEKLTRWADVIRKTFYEGGSSDIISTRRLVHICEAFLIFNQNKMKAIEMCLNRFDTDTKRSFMELYKKLDETVEETPPAPSADADEIAF